MANHSHIQIGDVYRIPLPDGTFTYCQYVYSHPRMGYLVRVFDLTTTEPLNSVEQLAGANDRFPPVFVGLRATVRNGRWIRIGNLKVEDFAFPKFRQTMSTKPGTYHDWRIWDGKETVFIGDLPESLRGLQLQSVWADMALENRIIAGTYRGDRMF